jgi:hypothetical protein
MKLKKMLAGYLLMLVLALPPVVSAADFNLNMKTSLLNLHPDVTAVKVECNVSRPSRPGKVFILGEGSTTEKVSTNGAIDKNILVKFNALSGMNPADAENFLCKLIFLSRQRPDAEPLAANQKGCTQAVNEFLCAKKGTSFNKIISGAIPKGSTGNSRSGVKTSVGSNSSRVKTRSGVVMELRDK